MPTYKVKIEAEVEIEAENVAQAYAASRKWIKVRPASACHFASIGKKGRNGATVAATFGAAKITKFGLPVLIDNPAHGLTPVVFKNCESFEVDARLNKAWRELSGKQEPLGDDFQTVHDKCRWDLYEE